MKELQKREAVSSHPHVGISHFNTESSLFPLLHNLAPTLSMTVVSSCEIKILDSTEWSGLNLRFPLLFVDLRDNQLE